MKYDISNPMIYEAEMRYALMKSLYEAYTTYFWYVCINAVCVVCVCVCSACVCVWNVVLVSMFATHLCVCVCVLVCLYVRYIIELRRFYASRIINSNSNMEQNVCSRIERALKINANNK